MNPLAILSMLHEGPDHNSATRIFRNDRVISWTLSRTSLAKKITDITILCWDDQRESVGQTFLSVDHPGIKIISRGRRAPLQSLDPITAARRWSDGWRGGVLQSCDFDLGFDPQTLLSLPADDFVLIDPAAALVDPLLIDAIITRAAEKPDLEMIFTSAAPGLGGALVRRVLLDRLAKIKLHPGKLLHYLPAAPAKDPIAGEAHVPAPVSVMRTTRQFKLNSDRQITRLTSALQPLNGELIGSSAEQIVARVHAEPPDDAMPREIKLELTTKRSSKPIFLPRQCHFSDTVQQHQQSHHREIDAKAASAIFTEIGAYDDIRLTLAGIGDPLNHPHLSEIISLAKTAGITAISIETDVLSDPTPLANPAIDIVAFHLPATTAATYAKVMGVDGCETVLKNFQKLLALRGENSTPILVPIFTKCSANLHEMESWYDYWLRALGSAVIDGPSDFAGQIADVSVADMTPLRRSPCNRLNNRMTILSDGTIVACENDFSALHPAGRIGADSIRDIWQTKFTNLREAHRTGSFSIQPLCSQCKDWHRP